MSKYWHELTRGMSFPGRDRVGSWVKTFTGAEYIPDWTPVPGGERALHSNRLLYKWLSELNVEWLQAYIEIHNFLKISPEIKDVKIESYNLKRDFFFKPKSKHVFVNLMREACLTPHMKKNLVSGID